MNKVTLHFLKSGINTLVQDSGRQGFQKFGVPVSGYMDKPSARMANWLVGNDPNAALFEITMVGPTIQVDNQCIIANTGADLSLQINNKPAPMFQTVVVEGGSIISFGKLRSGCRSYLAFGGELEVFRWLGSCSAAAFDAESLTPDSVIGKESKILLKSVDGFISRNNAPQSLARSGTSIRVLPGPEYNDFSGDNLHYFFNQPFSIGADSNRMGYRLVESIPGFSNDTEVISSAIIPGTIQVTNSAQPIILMADAQTSGGYPRIANIISADLAKVAQLKPGEKISFRPITLQEALSESGEW